MTTLPRSFQFRWSCEWFSKEMKLLITIGTLAFYAVTTCQLWSQINEWTSLGWPEGGEIQRLVVDPQNPNTLYAVGAVYAENRGVGLFKSTDAGANWRSINFGLTAPAVYTLMMDPQNPTTLYVGTWGSGVFKSIDGGESWGSTALTRTFISALTVDPKNPKTVYAAAFSGGRSYAVSGLYKSTDAGATWSLFSGSLEPNIQVLAVDPQGTVYAGEGLCCEVGGLYKSSDNGNTWIVVPELDRKSVV